MNTEAEKETQTTRQAVCLTDLLSAKDEFIKAFMAEIDEQIAKDKGLCDDKILAELLTPIIRKLCKDSATEGFEAGLNAAEKLGMI